MNQPTPTSLPKSEMRPQEPGSQQTKTLRDMNTWLCLYGLCARRACRRARDCRGAPHECLRRYAPLVPQAAREQVLAIFKDRLRGLPLDPLRWRPRGAIDELDAWIGAIEHSYARGAKE